MARGDDSDPRDTATRWADPGRQQGGRYTVLGELARGGLGRVYTATDDALGRTVAIKEVLEPNPETLARFEREAKLTARLQHAGVVPVYDIGRWENGEPFFVMKLVEGRSLADLIGETRSFDARLALVPRVLAVCDTMAYAHSRGVVHRDLKPSNIIISSYGETVVIDWGLATVTSEADPGGHDLLASTAGSDVALTQEGRVLGTLQFMAPEQAKGQLVDQRADVYALGAILYNVLAGEEPYAESSSARTELIQLVRSTPPTPLRQRAPSVPDDLVAIADKAMAREPPQRYASARELAEDLHRFLDGQLVSAHRYPAHVLVARWLRRHRAAVTVAAVLLAASATAAVIGVRRVVAERNAAVEARRVALAGQNALVLLQAERSLEDDPTAALAWLKRYRSPGQGPARPQLAGDQNDSDWLARVVAEEAVARGVARHVFSIDATPRGLAVSPTDPLMAVGSPDGTVWVHNLDTGERRKLGRHGDAVVHVAFSPIRAALASVDAQGGLRLWGAGGQLLHQVALGAAPSPRFALAFSPDGGRLAVGLDDRLVVVTVADPARRTTHRLGERYGWLSFCDSGALVVTTLHAGSAFVLEADGSAPRRLAGAHPDARLRCLPGSRRFVTGGVDGDVRIWDLARGAPTLLGAHDDWVIDMAVSPDGTLLATGSGDDTIRLHPLAGGAPRILRGHQDSVSAVVFSRDGRRLASASRESVRIWDVASGELIRVYRTPLMRAAAIALTHDGRHVVAGGRNEARVWPVDSPHGRFLRGHRDFVVFAAWSPDARTLASGGRDRTVRFWDLESGASWASPPLDSWVMAGQFIGSDGLLAGTRGGRVVRFDLTTRTATAVPAPPPTVSGLSPSLALAPTGDRVVLSDAGVVVVHQLASGRNVRIDTTLEGVTVIELTRDGSRVAMATSAGIAGVWDARTGGKLALRTIQRFPIRDLALTPDGRRMALLATNDYRLLLWDHQEDRMKALPSDGAVKGSLFFPDGRTLAYLAGDRSVRLVDVDDGTTRVLRGHRVGMVDAALSPARPIFATGDAGGFVRLWDHRTGSSALLQAHTGAIEALSFSPDGRWLVTAGQDDGGSLRVWDLASLPLTAPPTPATIDHWLGSQTSANVHGAREVRTLAPDAR